MKLEFLDASNNDSKYRANVHITGKLGFSTEAMEYMDLANRKFFKIAHTLNSKVNRLYLVDSQEDDQTARVYKAGKYYYLKLSSLLRRIGLDYKANSVSFIIEKGEYEGKDMFILTEHRNKPRKEGEKEEGDEELDSSE